MQKPVIFIPGFPGSELLDATSGATVYPPSITTLLDPAKKQQVIDEVVDVPGKLVPGRPLAGLFGGLLNGAQSLYDVLHNDLGYDVSGTSSDFIPIGWDWRR